MRVRDYAVSILVLSFLGLLAQSALAHTLRESFDRTLPLREGGRIVLENTNGKILVEGWDQDEVSVRAEKIVKAGSRDEAAKIMKRVRIDVEAEEDRVAIYTHIPRRKDGFWDWILGDRVQVTVEYHLRVPKRLLLNVETVNGGVTVRSVRGTIQVASTNGGVRIHEAGGQIEVRTTNGGIEAEIVELAEREDMDFKTTNGGIRVYFPEDLRAYVEAKTTNGSVTTDFPVEVRGEVSGKRFEGTINGGGGRIQLKTTNGSIKILSF